MIRKLFRPEKLIPVESQPAVVKAASLFDEVKARYDAAMEAVESARRHLANAEETAGQEVLNGAALADLHEHHHRLAKAQSEVRILAHAVHAADEAHQRAIKMAKTELAASLRAEYLVLLKELKAKAQAANEALGKARTLRHGGDYGLGNANPLRGAPDPLCVLDEQALEGFDRAIDAWSNPKPRAIPDGTKLIRLRQVPYGPGGPLGVGGRRLTNLNAGEIGGFPTEIAAEWVQAGLAEYVS